MKNIDKVVVRLITLDIIMILINSYGLIKYQSIINLVAVITIFICCGLKITFIKE